MPTELVDEFVFLIAFDLTFVQIVKSTIFIPCLLDASLRSLLVLKICLSIEVFGLDVANTLWRRAIKQDEVTREVLILLDFDDLADLDLTPSPSHEPLDNAFGFSDCSAYHGSSVVFVIIRYVPLKVFVDIFNHGETHDKT